jgi:hypothetical protein
MHALNLDAAAATPTQQSLAATHMTPSLLDRIVTVEAEQLNLGKQWRNYRISHSDNKQYGDLDPRFGLDIANGIESSAERERIQAMGEAVYRPTTREARLESSRARLEETKMIKKKHANAGEKKGCKMKTSSSSHHDQSSKLHCQPAARSHQESTGAAGCEVQIAGAKWSELHVEEKQSDRTPLLPEDVSDLPPLLLQDVSHLPPLLLEDVLIRAPLEGANRDMVLLVNSQETIDVLAYTMTALIRMSSGSESSSSESSVSRNMPIALGLDCEWRPDVSSAATPKGPAAATFNGRELRGVLVFQVSTSWTSFVIDMQLLCQSGRSSTDPMNAMEEKLNSCLMPVLISPFIYVVGLGVSQDLLLLNASYPHFSCFRHVCSVCDIGPLFKRVFSVNTPSTTLSRARKKGSCTMRSLNMAYICAQVLGRTLDKSMQCSPWHERPLSFEQVQYAALDAAVSVSILQKLLLMLLSDSVEERDGSRDGSKQLKQDERIDLQFHIECRSQGKGEHLHDSQQRFEELGWSEGDTIMRNVLGFHIAVLRSKVSS